MKNWIVVHSKHLVALTAGAVLRFCLHVTQTIAVDFEARVSSRVIRWLSRKDKKP